MDAEKNARRRRHRISLRIATAALVLCLLALVWGAYQFARYTERVEQEAARQVELSNRIRQMQAMLVALKTAESAKRGYFLTGEAMHLGAYESAVAELKRQLDTLSKVPVVNEKNAQRVSAIREFAQLKLQEWAETMRLFHAGRRSEALALLQSTDGHAQMEQAQAELMVAMDVIRSDRDEVAAQLVATNHATRRVTTIGAAIVVAAVVLVLAQLATLLAARRRNEQELQDSERQHRALVEEQKDLVALAREDGTLTYLNRAYSQYFGRTIDEMLGTSLFEVVYPPHREMVRDHLTKVFETGTALRLENRMVSPDGSEKWVSWSTRCRPAPTVNGGCIP
jgi:PAS domain S-box-containing protein